MVYVTGDLHGDIDRLFDREWRKLKRNDTVIACGDFGFLWDGDEKEREVLKYLSTRKYNVAFLDGTHDNYDRIATFRRTVWKGGLVHRIGDHLYHLERGQIFTIENRTIFTFGGGESIDKDMRLQAGKWWKEEIPSPSEMAAGAEKLDECERKVDYILTHEPPSKVKSAMLMRRGEIDRVNKLNGYFDQISRLCEFKHWYFGSLHEDKMITPKHSCVFKKLIPLEQPNK